MEPVGQSELKLMQESRRRKRGREREVSGVEERGSLIGVDLSRRAFLF